MDNKAWQVEHSERMSNTEEEKILVTTDRKSEGKESCHTLKQCLGTCLDEMQ